MSVLSSKRRSMLPIGVVVLVLLCGAIWVLTRPRTDTVAPRRAGPAAVLVTTVEVKQQDMPIYLTGVGTVAAKESVTVRPRIDGQLDKIAFTEGQDVKAGQLLAQLDPRTQQAQLAQAQAQKARDEAQLANAKLDLNRTTVLIKQDAATRQTLDAQRAQVAQLTALVQSDDAQINLATVQLSFTRITAPISGRVGARLVDAGNLVHTSDANGLVVINQIDPITVVFSLPEDSFQDINRALHGNARPLTVVAYPRNSDEALGQGSLILLNNEIDTATGTVQLKGSFPNPEHRLWPGQYVNARLILGDRQQALTVPASAVQRGPDGTYAYVVEADNTVRMQPVQVVNIQDGIAVIDKGLSAKQRVVLDGQYKLRPGLKITESSTKAATPVAAPEATPPAISGIALGGSATSPATTSLKATTPPQGSAK